MKGRAARSSPLTYYLVTTAWLTLLCFGAAYVLRAAEFREAAVKLALAGGCCLTLLLVGVAWGLADRSGQGANYAVSVAREIIIKDTHRGLWYENGILVRVLEAGRYELPKGPEFDWRGRRRHPKIEVVFVDVRERELTLKGQEILTSDKVAIRVSIIVQFRVVDPRAALHEVENFEERLYSDVQLAARRSLASMSLEQILTNRNQLSEDILSDVKETARRYGVSIGRADVKDLIFPGNLQEIMNKVLAAERMSQAALVEARTKARQQQIDAGAKAEIQKLESQSYVTAQWASAESAAESHRIRTEAEVRAAKEMAAAASAYAANPALLRLRELETLRELARNANARIYIGFDKHAAQDSPPAGETDVT